MSSIFWDPANLLQISSHVDSTRGDIHCVGQAQSRWGTRCRWTIGEPRRSEIRSLLKVMSEEEPHVVTKEVIIRLAEHCLCQKYHYDQIYETADRWTGVIERAAQHQDNLIATYGGKASQGSTQHAADLETQLKFMDEKNSRLETQIRDLVSDRLETRNSASKESADKALAQEELATRTSQLEEASKQIKSCQADLLALQEETRLDQSKAQLRASQSERDQLKRTNEELEVAMMKSVKSSDSLMRNFDELSIECCKVKDDKKKLAEKCRAAEDSLQLCSAELEQERDRKSALGKQMAMLEDSRDRLSESISACWLHGFWAFVARFRGPSKYSYIG